MAKLFAIKPLARRHSFLNIDETLDLCHIHTSTDLNKYLPQAAWRQKTEVLPSAEDSYNKRRSTARLRHGVYCTRVAVHRSDCLLVRRRIYYYCSQPFEQEKTYTVQRRWRWDVRMTAGTSFSALHRYEYENRVILIFVRQVRGVNDEQGTTAWQVFVCTVIRRAYFIHSTCSKVLCENGRWQSS